MDNRNSNTTMFNINLTKEYEVVDKDAMAPMPDKPKWYTGRAAPEHNLTQRNQASNSVEVTTNTPIHADIVHVLQSTCTPIIATVELTGTKLAHQTRAAVARGIS
jgi:hypothetical protein